MTARLEELVKQLPNKTKENYCYQWTLSANSIIRNCKRTTRTRRNDSTFKLRRDAAKSADTIRRMITS